MGQKQRALVQDLTARRLRCLDPLNELKDGCREIIDLNERIEAVTKGGNHAQAKQLQQAKNPSYGKINKAKVSLKSLLAELEGSIQRLDDFAKEKAKRWLGKSTLKDAQMAVSAARTHVTHVRQVVATATDLM